MSGPAFLWGKLPAHGDFVCRGLPADERDALDDWLAAGLQEQRGRLGTAFELHYDEAPPWRFRWMEGEGWTVGALVPSMDSVGRRYPLMVGRRLVSEEQCLDLAAAAEEAIYRAFEAGHDADALLAEVSALDGSASHAEHEDFAPPPLPPADGWWTLGGTCYPPACLASARPAGLWAGILARVEGAAA